MNEYEYNDITVGIKEEFEVDLTEDKMAEFLSISGDVNPLHLDSDYAKSMNFKGRLVYGLLTSVFYSTLIGNYIPGRYGFLQSIHIKFASPVYIGDRLNILGEVTYKNDAFKVIEIKSKILNQEKICVSSSKIVAGMLK